MQTTRYLIVGGGLTADAACKGIRELDPDGRVLLVTEEPHPPYSRPPLSKGLWRGKEESTIWRGTEALGVDVRPGRRIVALDLERRLATDERGDEHGYEKLLLATGGRPRRLPFGGEDVLAFRTLDDYRRLRELAEGGARCVVVGGGFIGSEVAAALALQGCPVTLAFPEQGIGARVFPLELSLALVDYYRTRGVEVLPGASVTGIEPGRVLLGDGRVLPADVVVAGIGIEPAVDML
ncbi:MAG TPA: NAD(P)/FAD-dependent oxidoreductase, partial [Gaiellaceae bacterium]|nr:NAD(P)/FAD-dependent oxidoreductase [Gaiellaceae bacterium]